MATTKVALRAPASSSSSVLLISHASLFNGPSPWPLCAGGLMLVSPVLLDVAASPRVDESAAAAPAGHLERLLASRRMDHEIGANLAVGADVARPSLIRQTLLAAGLDLLPHLSLSMMPARSLWFVLCWSVLVSFGLSSSSFSFRFLLQACEEAAFSSTIALVCGRSVVSVVLCWPQAILGTGAAIRVAGANL